MPDRILLPLIVACALFMENLDSTVLSTALPAIAADFGESPIRLKLALTSYLLSIAIFIPASGWIADRFGARLVFRMAILIFTVGSILCGLSQSVTEIVSARILQGIGGAMMVPVGRMVILRSVPKADLVGSLAWLTVPALVGPVIGPPLGGFITTYFEWRWIFWINIPVGLLGLVLATIHVPDFRGDRRTPFDSTGFVLSAVGLAMFMTGSTSLGLGFLPVSTVLILFFGGSALLAAYVLYARKAANPIVDLSLFLIPTFALSLIGASVFRIAIGAGPFLLPLLLQIGFGMTPFRSGLITFASAIGAIAMKFAAPPLLRRFGFRTVLVVNSPIAGLFVAMPAAFAASTPVAAMIGLLLVSGFFRSLQFSSVNALTFADIPHEKIGRATTLASVIQQLSISVGISVGAISLQLAADATGGTISAGSFAGPFVLIGFAAGLAAIPFLFLRRNAGDEMSGRRPIAPDPVTVMRERG